MSIYGMYPQEPLEAMYPDIYYQVYPKVKMYCEMYDVPMNSGLYPYPNRTAVEQMTDYIYQNVGTAVETKVEQQFGGGFGGRIVRSLITILLIRELLRRRGPYYYYY